MNINVLIESTLSGVTKNIYPMSCPLETKPDEFIVYTIDDSAEDFGDDTFNAFVYHVEINWFKKPAGTTAKKPVNYFPARDKIRTALKEAGFALSNITHSFETDTGYTSQCFICQIEEDA